MKKLFAVTLALGLLSAPAFANPVTDIVNNVTNAAKNNPVAAGLITVGLLSALNNSDDTVVKATATATATSTSTSTSTATK